MNMNDSLSLPSNSFEQVADFFKVLNHPIRLQILECLRIGECCVCHLEAHLNCRQAYLSQQLSVLREAGLIADRREGWNIYYSVSNPHVFQLLDSVYQALGSTPPLIQPNPDCPCPHCSGKNTCK
jgi:DNA-binding transcriptional ArsR family regulator